MSGPELGLAIWAAVDLGLKWGNKVIVLCHSFKNAPKEFSERVVRVETCWMRISQQMEHTKKVVAHMQPAHQELHLHTLEILSGRLQAVYRELSAFSSLLNSSNSANEDKEETSRRSAAMIRTMYAFKKKGIDESISELEKWQSTFDISWLLILKVANQTLATGDEMIATQERLPNITENIISQSHPMPAADRAVFLRPDGIDMSNASSITFCEARHLTKGSESLILDSLTCSSTSKLSRSLVVKDVKSLAQKLYAHQDQGYGLFKCKGVLKRETRDQNEDQLNFTLVFKVPRYLQEPQSMRRMLLRAECPHSLSEVVRIGQELAKAVSYIHLLDFVHKKIRPESILLLRHMKTGHPAAYLVGFQKFRKDGGMTSLLGSSDWQQMLYCHPRRYGQRPEDAYIMQHDIYSLGVCLLEIGLWESLITYGESGQPIPSQLIKDYLPSSGMGSIESLKQHLVMLARTRLPRRIGSKYAEIVETCLTCLDDGNADFGDESEFLDADGVLVGVRYIEKVITKLDLINV